MNSRTFALAGTLWAGTLSLALLQTATAQLAQDWFRITDGFSCNHMYRWYLANPVRFRQSLKVEIQSQRFDKGQVPSRDDYTRVAFCYQEEPHQGIALQPFAERVAPSKTIEYKTKEEGKPQAVGPGQGRPVA